jgi:hypothetical protein
MRILSNCHCRNYAYYVCSPLSRYFWVSTTRSQLLYIFGNNILQGTFVSLVSPMEHIDESLSRYPRHLIHPTSFSVLHSPLTLVINNTVTSTFTMGKNDEKQTNKRVHKATDGESKRKNKPSFDTPGSSPFATTYEDNDGRCLRSQWLHYYRQLCEYKVKFGHCLVPQPYSTNPRLGRWVASQRTRYSKNTGENTTYISAEYIRALDRISFDWGTNKTVFASIWSVRFQKLCEFRVQFGHCLVPFKYDANLKLGKWVSRQRSNYKLYQEGKPNPMTAERIRQLESVEFEWVPTVGSWNERFDQFGEFKVQCGHCLVPIKYSTHLKLRKWVSNQRSNYKLYQEGKPNPMTAERIRQLESVGFEWDTTVGLWNERFEQMREFKVQFGHCLVPIKYSANLKLGKWVSNQRSNYKLYQEGKPNPMTAERIRQLESVGFEWSSKLGRTSQLTRRTSRHESRLTDPSKLMRNAPY